VFSFLAFSSPLLFKVLSTKKIMAANAIKLSACLTIISNKTLFARVNLVL